MTWHQAWLENWRDQEIIGYNMLQPIIIGDCPIFSHMSSVQNPFIILLYWLAFRDFSTGLLKNPQNIGYYNHPLQYNHQPTMVLNTAHMWDSPSHSAGKATTSATE